MENQTLGILYLLRPFTCPLTWLKAASAFIKSPSLKLLNAPPPGVLAPLITEPDRERTFMTKGLAKG